MGPRGTRSDSISTPTLDREAPRDKSPPTCQAASTRTNEPEPLLFEPPAASGPEDESSPRSSSFLGDELDDSDSVVAHALIASESNGGHVITADDTGRAGVAAAYPPIPKPTHHASLTPPSSPEVPGDVGRFTPTTVSGTLACEPPVATAPG